jgi:transcription-repair coupling factor (superfamily II helicase)
MLLLFSDDFIAEEIWVDLCVLIGNEMPIITRYEILPYEERSPHYSIRATRMETLLSTFQNSTSGIYSLSIRALGRFLPSRDLLGRHILHLQQGMEYDPDVLLHKLYDMGYDIQSG